MNYSFLTTENHLTLFEKSARHHADKVAVFDDSCSYSYWELLAQAKRIADHLRSEGVTTDTPVAVCLQRSADWIVALLAIWEAGGCYVPFDSALPVDRINYAINTSAVSIGIIDEYTAHKFQDLSKLVKLDRAAAPPVSVSTVPASFGIDVNERDRAYIIFTSGTTGYPKGVQIDHGNVANMAMEHVLSKEIRADDTVALCASFGFDASLRDIVGTLIAGATLYVASKEDLELSAFCSMLANRRISYTVVTPMLLAAVGAPPLLPDLRTLVVAGEAPSPELIRAWGAGRLLINAYGPTEVTVCATKRLYPLGAIAGDLSVSIGTPTYGISAQVLDEHLMPVPAGGLGELYLGGASVSSRGYLHNEALNAHKFVELPALGGRAYRTGDKCRLLSNGELEWVERVDGQIKINGFRVESSEVRAAITSLSCIRDCVVHPWQANGRTYLIAYVVMTETQSRLHGKSVSIRIRDEIRDRLPAYAMPSFFIKLDRIPLTLNGKVDFSLLPTPEATIAPTLPHGVEGTAAALWAIWFDVLPKELAAEYSLDTRFQDGGGSSIQAQLILQRIAQRWDRQISYRRFLDGGGTIRWTTHLLEAGENYQASVTTHGPAAESGDLSGYVGMMSPRLQLAHREKPGVRSRQRWLLTGATGFLGAHLLSCLTQLGIQITCLVREDTAVSAQVRLGRSLDRYGLSLDLLKGRVEVVAGDLLRENLGLSREMYQQLSENLDAIVHCAADVDFIKTYEQLEAINVRGTADVVRLAATGRLKKLYHVSTLAVFFSAGAAAALPGEVSSGSFGHGVLGGYAQSKWVSEQIVLDARTQGLDVTIFRPARLWNDAEVLRHHEQDLYVRLLRFIALTQKVPDIDFAMDFTRVGSAANVIARLAIEAPSDYYHILDERTVHLQQLVNWIGTPEYEIELVSYRHWLQLINTELGVQTLGPLVSIFLDQVNQYGSLFDNLLRLPQYASSLFPNENTRRALNDSQPFTGVDAPRSYLARCFEPWRNMKKDVGAKNHDM